MSYLGIWFVLVLLIVAGFFQPKTYLETLGDVAFTSLWIAFWLYVIASAPLLPLVALILRFSRERAFHPGICRGLAVLAGVVGLFLSLLSFGLSGAGSVLSFWQGMGLTSAVIGSALMLAATRFAWTWALFFVLPLGLALWSLVAGRCRDERRAGGSLGSGSALLHCGTLWARG